MKSPIVAAPVDANAPVERATMFAGSVTRVWLPFVVGAIVAIVAKAVAPHWWIAIGVAVGVLVLATPRLWQLARRH